MKRLYSLLNVLSLIILLCLSKSVVNGYERISKSLLVIPDLNSVSKKAVINEYEAISNENIASPVIGATSYDWLRKRIKQDTSYKGNIEIENLSASPFTIISANGGNPNFIVDLKQFTNLKLQPGQKKTFTVEFKPLSIGEKNLTINFITDIAGVTAQSVLKGTGIIGQLRTTDINFDTMIVGTVKPNSHKLTIECINSAFEDSVTIKDLVVTSGTINPELSVFSADGFRYDKEQLKLQKTLKPGERITVNCEFLAHSTGVHIASLRTVSDAETEVTSHWVGYGKNKLSVPINSEDNKSINNLRINPNPSGENGSVVLFTLGEKGYTELTVFDNSGVLAGALSLGTVDAGSYTIKAPIEGLSSGTYMLRLSSGPYKQEQQIVIVK